MVDINKWNELINMSHEDLTNYYNSDLGQQSGLSPAFSQKLGIRSGRDSAQAIIQMKQKDPSQWTEEEMDWAKRQISFVSRMKAGRGPLYKENGEPSRRLMSLWIWGHNPEGAELPK